MTTNTDPSLLTVARDALQRLTDLGIDLDGEQEEIIAGIRIDLDEAINKETTREKGGTMTMEEYEMQCHENGEPPCNTIYGHEFVVSDEDENYCYCENCGCVEF